MRAKRLVLMRTRAVGDFCTVRDYRIACLKWVRYPITGVWVAFEGFKKVATVDMVNPERWMLNYAFSRGPQSSVSGGCYKDTADECKGYFEAIYSGSRNWKHRKETP